MTFPGTPDDENHDSDELLGGVVLVGSRLGDVLDQLQIVVLCKVQYEAIGHGLHFVQSAIYENGFLTFVVYWRNVWRIAHCLVGAKSRENTAKSFGPVAGAEPLACDGKTDDDERGV